MTETNENIATTVSVMMERNIYKSFSKVCILQK